MSFFSVEFVAIVGVLLGLYYVIPRRFQWPLLLAGSVVLYALSSSLVYTALLLLSTLLDFGIARAIAYQEDKTVRARLLTVSVLANLGVLFYFKYLDFFNTSLESVFEALGVAYNVSVPSAALPLGVSFYTFTKIAYVVDVFRRVTPAERNLGVFATFITLFPNVSAGPIERKEHLRPQLTEATTFDDGRIVAGLRRILWGAFKKVVIAEMLALYVDGVFSDPHGAQGATFVVATIFYAFQIYADFSGYTDIAIGIAQLFGLTLFENFRQPYFAVTVTDFWRRWHMSLTNWIREFMYMPMTRSLLRRTKGITSPRVVQVASYVIVMTLVGLWHGAGWTFVIWGVLHGVYMGVELVLPPRLRLPPKKRWEIVTRTVITFALVSLAWIFFRAASVADAWHVLTHLPSVASAPLSTLLDPFPVDTRFTSLLSALGWVDAAPNTIKTVQFAAACGLIGVLLGADTIARAEKSVQIIQRTPRALRWAFYYLLIGLIFVSLNSGAGVQEFVYSQF